MVKIDKKKTTGSYCCALSVWCNERCLSMLVTVILIGFSVVTLYHDLPLMWKAVVVSPRLKAAVAGADQARNTLLASATKAMTPAAAAAATTSEQVEQQKKEAPPPPTKAPVPQLPPEEAEVQNKLRTLGATPLFDPSTNNADPWKTQLYKRLDKIRAACGKLCQLNTVADIEQHSTPTANSNNTPFPTVRVGPVQCPDLLELGLDVHARDTSVPAIPDELRPYFALQDDKIRITSHQRKDETRAPTTTVWTAASIDDMAEKVAAGTLEGAFGVDATTRIRDVLGNVPDGGLMGKSVLVLGSNGHSPWLESILLHYGASKITTLHFGKITSQHPLVTPYNPETFHEAYKAGAFDNLFDGIVSHVTLAKWGLGRYGDILNPWADILTVARAWCLTKDKGFMYLGLLTGEDVIQSNWHRVYGMIRWPLVTANWEAVPQPTSSSEKDYNLLLHQGMWHAQTNGGEGFLFRKLPASPTR